MSKLNTMFSKMMEIIYTSLPINEKVVFFESFSGKYNDNPRYISEQLHNLNPEIPIVWCKALGEDDFPDYVSTVEKGSMEYLKTKCTAIVSIDNYIGSVFHYGKHFGHLIQKLLNRSSRLNISTWHGTPLKKIGADVFKDAKHEAGFYSSSTYLVAGCTYTKECLEKSVYNRIPVRMLGTPRNDILFNSETVSKEDLGIPSSKKVCLFAPTYRDNLEYSGVRQLKEINIDRLIESLHRKFGGEWVFVFRVHHTVEEYINNEKVLDGKNAISGNIQNRDMAEYLCVTDLLITDYSGSLFDFAITGRPCILYTPDKETYCKKPGLYMDLECIPFPKTDCFDGIIDAVGRYDESKIGADTIDFLSKIGNIEDGHASERIVTEIVNRFYGE